MNPREIVAEIEKRDYKATTRTLQTYVNKNLVPEPKRSGGGRGIGKIAEYPEETIYEYIASYELINGAAHKVSPDELKIYRKRALELESAQLEKESLAKEYAENIIVVFGAFLWLAYRDLAKAGKPLDGSVGVQYTIGKDGRLARNINEKDKNGLVKMGISL